MKYIVHAAMALALLSSSAAIAQPSYQDHRNQAQVGQGFDGRHNDRPRYSRGDRLPERYRQKNYVVSDWRQHNLRAPSRGHHWVRDDNNQYFLVAITSGIIANIMGQTQDRSDRQWSRGERLSDEYRNRRYIVSDWRAMGLHRPTRGYHWVRANNQYLLVGVRSGRIQDIRYNN